jgi:hypothetical protein
VRPGDRDPTPPRRGWPAGTPPCPWAAGFGVVAAELAGPPQIRRDRRRANHALLAATGLAVQTQVARAQEAGAVQDLAILDSGHFEFPTGGQLRGDNWPPTITGCYVLLPTKVGAGAV